MREELKHGSDNPDSWSPSSPTLLMIGTEVHVLAPPMVSNCGIAVGVATGSLVKAVKSMFVAVKLSVLGTARVSRGSSVRMLFVHFERDRSLYALRDFGFPLRKENSLPRAQGG